MFTLWHFVLGYKEYRRWIAHKNCIKPSTPDVVPKPETKSPTQPIPISHPNKTTRPDRGSETVSIGNDLPKSNTPNAFFVMEDELKPNTPKPVIEPKPKEEPLKPKIESPKPSVEPKPKEEPLKPKTESPKQPFVEPKPKEEPLKPKVESPKPPVEPKKPFVEPETLKPNIEPTKADTGPSKPISEPATPPKPAIDPSKSDIRSPRPTLEPTQPNIESPKAIEPKIPDFSFISKSPQEPDVTPIKPPRKSDSPRTPPTPPISLKPDPPRALNREDELLGRQLNGSGKSGKNFGHPADLSYPQVSSPTRVISNPDSLESSEAED